MRPGASPFGRSSVQVFVTESYSQVSPSKPRTAPTPPLNPPYMTVWLSAELYAIGVPFRPLGRVPEGLSSVQVLAVGS